MSALQSGNGRLVTMHPKGASSSANIKKKVPASAPAKASSPSQPSPQDLQRHLQQAAEHRRMLEGVIRDQNAIYEKCQRAYMALKAKVDSTPQANSKVDSTPRANSKVDSTPHPQGPPKWVQQTVPASSIKGSLPAKDLHETVAALERRIKKYEESEGSKSVAVTDLAASKKAVEAVNTQLAAKISAMKAEHEATKRERDGLAAKLKGCRDALSLAAKIVESTQKLEAISGDQDILHQVKTSESCLRKMAISISA